MIHCPPKVQDPHELLQDIQIPFLRWQNIIEKENKCKLMIKFNNEQMLTDKTQFFNRLGNSGCTVKSNTFGQAIKSPYMAQYKIFEERIKNPKMKTMSMVMRKRKIEDNLGKQNMHSELRQFQHEQCIKEARKILNNEQNKFTVFSTHTIEYDVNQNSRQSEVMLKFKQKLNDLKIMKHESTGNERSRLSTVSFASQTLKYRQSDILSSVGSQHSRCSQLKPLTAQMFSKPRCKVIFNQRQSFEKNNDDQKLKPSLTFITYKKNKFLAEKFAKDKV